LAVQTNLLHMTSGMRLVITGGRGRLAGLLADSLKDLGYQVRCSSRVADERFVDYHEVTSSQFLDSVDAVLHLAWSTVPAVAERVPGAEWETDLPYMASMLRAVSRLPESRRPHVVFFSSGGTVYGEAPEDRGSREDDQCHPIGWYGRAKLAAESLVNEFATVYGLASTTLRVSNPYGYAMDPTKPQGLIAHLIHAALGGKELSIWGDGLATKDYLSSTDLCNAVMQVLEVRPAGIFNVAAGQSHSVNEIVSMVRDISGAHIAIRYHESFKWDVRRSRIDIGKIRAVLGWEPQVPIRAGISDLWRTAILNREKDNW
jgi:UDP-glucose 4-epimerase